MKRMINFAMLFLALTCTYQRAEWDSGAKANESYHIQRMEDNSETVRDQFPTTDPGTEKPQPL